MLEDEWPSSMFRVWYFIMNVHFRWAQWNLNLQDLFADSNMAKTKNQKFFALNQFKYSPVRLRLNARVTEEDGLNF